MICSSELFLNPDQPPCPLKTPPQHDATTTMLHCRAGVGQVMMLRIKAKKFSLGLISLGNIVAHSLVFNCWDMRCFFFLLRRSFCPFLSRSLSLDTSPDLRRVLVVSVVFHFGRMKATVLLENLNAAKSSRTLSRWSAKDGPQDPKSWHRHCYIMYQSQNTCDYAPMIVNNGCCSFLYLNYDAPFLIRASLVTVLQVFTVPVSFCWDWASWTEKRCM